MSLFLDPRLELVTYRCENCGRYWALENGVYGACPKCEWNKSVAAEVMRRKLARQVAALRGALVRAKRAAHVP